MTTITTPGTNKAWAPDVQELDPLKVIPDSLLMLCTLKVGEVQGDDVFVRVPRIDLTNEPEFVPEGQPIPESDPDIDEDVIANGKIGVLVKSSIEQLSQPNATELISREIGRAMALKVNAALLNQAMPVSPAVIPPAGIKAQGTTVATAISGNLDGLVDAISLIEDLPGGNASHIVASSSAWAKLQKLKTATGSNQPLVNPTPVEAFKRSVLGVPVLIDSSLAANQLVVLDKNKVLSVYGSVRVSKSEHAYFSSDVIGIKATIRFGTKVTDALACQVMTIE